MALIAPGLRARLAVLLLTQRPNGRDTPPQTDAFFEVSFQYAQDTAFPQNILILRTNTISDSLNPNWETSESPGRACGTYRAPHTWPMLFLEGTPQLRRAQSLSILSCTLCAGTHRRVASRHVSRASHVLHLRVFRPRTGFAALTTILSATMVLASARSPSAQTMQVASGPRPSAREAPSRSESSPWSCHPLRHLHYHRRRQRHLPGRLLTGTDRLPLGSRQRRHRLRRPPVTPCRPLVNHASCDGAIASKISIGLALGH